LVAAGDPGEEYVQVIAADGTVLVSSANVEGRDPLVELSPGEVTLEEVPFEDGPFLVLVVAASTPEGPGTIAVGRALEDVGDATRSAAGSLAIAAPLLLLVVGAVTWWVVGRALAPVEEMRAEVESISSHELHRRVPDPPGDDEISRLASTLNRMLERLEEAQVRQRRFVSDASHELRSPVASIRQHAELALAHPEEAELSGLAEVVLEEDLRLQRIVEDLLLLTRIDEGTLQLRAEPVDLDDLVFAEAERLRASSAVRIDTERVSAGRVLGDGDQLRRLVRNLADNAVRHAQATVAMSLSADGVEVVLTVDDDGPGISPDERERVFQRFVRLDEGRARDEGGTGLGLPIVREVAALHRGTVEVSEAPLGGARFRVRLPGSSA
jgi:signal transduction histidine kinase